jgi:predicted SprT family Zn-dependent metalloprotease
MAVIRSRKRKPGLRPNVIDKPKYYFECWACGGKAFMITDKYKRPILKKRRGIEYACGQCMATLPYRITGKGIRRDRA